MLLGGERRAELGPRTSWANSMSDSESEASSSPEGEMEEDGCEEMVENAGEGERALIRSEGRTVFVEDESEFKFKFGFEVGAGLSWSTRGRGTSRNFPRFENEIGRGR